MKIGLLGKAGSGKSSLARILVENFGFVELTFSESLYTILHFSQQTLGFEIAKDRKFLQWVGTDWARNQNPNVFCNCMKKKLDTISNPNVVVSDVRFVNEAEFLKENGFVLIRISRGASDTMSFRNHISETESDEISEDFVIKNFGTIENLKEKIKKFLQHT